MNGFRFLCPLLFFESIFAFARVIFKDGKAAK